MRRTQLPEFEKAEEIVVRRPLPRPAIQHQEHNHSHRAQLLWSFCVALIIALVALQQAIGSRSVELKSPEPHATQTLIVPGLRPSGE